MIESDFFSYDEFCDLLGGATWDHVFGHSLRSGPSFEREQALSLMASRFSSPNQYLFSGDSADPHPLEVLWLKWNLFESLCRKVLSIHKDHHGPNLNIEPNHVYVIIPEIASDFLPARWNFSLKIAEPEAALRFIKKDMPPDLAQRLYHPAKDPQGVYAAPIMRERPLGHEERVTILIQSMDQIREPVEGDIRGIIEANIISGDIQPSSFSDKDLFLITLYLSGEKAPPIHIWASKIASSDRGLLLKGVNEPVSPAVWKSMEKARCSVFSHSKLAIYRSYHIPCDLYSLGMILFRTLLVNDQQDMTGINEKVRYIADGIRPMVQGLDFSDNRMASKRIRLLFREEKETFSKKALLYQQEDRDNGSRSIPDDIWHDALILGLRLITSIPGFSFCHDHGDYDLMNPHVSMERVVSLAEIIQNRIKIEFFGSSRRNREILGACELARKELVDLRKE